jgi:hypothetical protein
MMNNTVLETILVFGMMMMVAVVVEEKTAIIHVRTENAVVVAATMTAAVVAWIRGMATHPNYDWSMEELHERTAVAVVEIATKKDET